MSAIMGGNFSLLMGRVCAMLSSCRMRPSLAITSERRWEIRSLQDRTILLLALGIRGKHRKQPYFKHMSPPQLHKTSQFHVCSDQAQKDLDVAQCKMS